jgi:hypothetical protein
LEDVFIDLTGRELRDWREEIHVYYLGNR